MADNRLSQDQRQCGSVTIHSTTSPLALGSSEEILTYDGDFLKVYRVLKGAVVYWENIGIELGMKTSVDKISADHASAGIDKCLRELISEWLKGRISHRPTWQKLYDAILQVDGIDQAIALEIERKYLKPAAPHAMRVTPTDPSRTEYAIFQGPATSLQPRPNEGQELNPGHLPALLRMLGNSAFFACQLGLQLGLHIDLIRTFQADSMGAPLNVLTSILGSWLKRRDPPPTREALATAIEKLPAGLTDQRLAQEVRTTDFNDQS